MHTKFRVSVGNLASLLLGGMVAAASGAQALYSHGDPTALEQTMLELVNAARLNPTQEGVFLNALNTWYSQSARTRKPSFFTNLQGEFAAYPAAQPLAFRSNLIQAARAHSQDMIDRNFFAHVNPDGLNPTARAAAAGYDSGVGENIDGGGASSGSDVLESHFGLMVDYDNIADATSHLGHRLNLLNSTYSEIGIGIRGVRSGGKITQDFGAPSRAYILGVAYADTNSNSSYDPGEGLAGITVTPDSGNYYAVTSASGGFAIPIEAVQTVTEDISIPLPVKTSPLSSIQPYDDAYRQQQMQNAPAMTVRLTWSGGGLNAPKVTSVTLKRPVLKNYRLMGTDGWFYTKSMLTTQNAKGDLILNAQGVASGWQWHAQFGWIWGAGSDWYGSSAFGWLWFHPGGQWVWSSSLQGWLAITDANSRTLWSTQFRWLTPSTADAYLADTTSIGKIHFGNYNGAAIPDSWVVSDRFGYVWANGDGQWFWSDGLKSWLGVTPDGGIWCVNQDRFL